MFERYDTRFDGDRHGARQKSGFRSHAEASAALGPLQTLPRANSSYIRETTCRRPRVRKDPRGCRWSVMLVACLSFRGRNRRRCRTFRSLMQDPTAWVAFITLIVMEVVLGIDNLIFISILTNKLPEEHRERPAASASAWRWSCGLRLLGTIAWIVQLTRRCLSFRPRLLLEGHDPDRRRPVPRLEGDQGNPPQRRSGRSRRGFHRQFGQRPASPPRSARSCCSISSSRSTASSPPSA